MRIPANGNFGPTKSIQRQGYGQSSVEGIISLIMIQRMFKLLLIGYLICLALPLAGNQTPTAAPVQPASDNFIGEWKLNAARSSPTAENEVLKIPLEYHFRDF